MSAAAVTGSARRDLREACVAEALAIIGREGLESLSLREVARRLNVSHQAPYKHFASRDHILAEIVRRAFDGFAAALDARPPTDDPAQDCRAMGRAYLDYARDNPLHYRLMFGGPLPNPAEHPEMMRSARHAFSLLRDGLGRAFAASGAPPGAIDIDSEALFVWSSVHGLASLLQTRAMTTLNLDGATLGGLADHVLDRIGAALGVAPPHSRSEKKGSPP
jgi:AcrR family transcriptional regulator